MTGEKNIAWFGASDIGRRQSNQDCFAAFPELGLWVLCDGMGGHAAGAEAAARAVAEVAAGVRAGRELTDAVAQAHLAVVELGEELLREDKPERRPGCTVVALRLHPEAASAGDNPGAGVVIEAEIVWVGDSRAWHWDGTNLTRLTTDHSVVQDLVNWGDLTEAEALVHPQRHQLVQALGVAGRGKLQPGRWCGTFRPQAEMIIITSDGAFCHEMLLDKAEIILKNINEPQEMVKKMIAESLHQGGEDNITVVAVGRTVETSVSGAESGPGFFGNLRRRLSRTFFLFSLIFLLFNFAAALSVRAEMPRGDELDSVCQEAAARLAERYGSPPLQQVAVYFLCPRGCREDKLDSQARREANTITMALQDALTARSEFMVLNRDNKVWARVLHEEGNRGTLDGNDIMRVGTGLGARWIVTGEYWRASDGRFCLNARLFNGKTGGSAAIAHVDSSFVSVQRHNWRPLLFGLAALLLLIIGGGVLLLFTRKRKVRSRTRYAESTAAVRQEELITAVSRRDPAICDQLNPELIATLPPEMRKIATALAVTPAGLIFDDHRGRCVIAAPGPEQGLGRGEKWLFSFSDPRISRAPQAHIKLDGGKVFIVHNHKANNQTLVNGEPIKVHALEIGLEIWLSSQTSLKVESLPATGVARLDVSSGPDAGRTLLLFKREFNCAELFAEIPAIMIVREKGRYLLCTGAQTPTAAGEKLILKNPDLSAVVAPLTPGSRLVLCSGDQLTTVSGRLLFAVTLPVL